MRNTFKVLFGLLSSLLISVTVYSQKNEVELQFKDGRTLKGLGKLRKKSIKYRLNSKVKPQFFSFQELEKIRVKQGTEWKSYESVNVEGMNKPLILQLVVEGRVNLYQKNDSGYMPMGPGGVGRFGGAVFEGGRFYAVTFYFVKRKSEKEAVRLGSSQLFSKNFKKAASEYFEDCTHLVEKIQDRSIKRGK